MNGLVNKKGLITKNEVHDMGSSTTIYNVYSRELSPRPCVELDLVSKVSDYKSKVANIVFQKSLETSQSA